MNITNGIPRYQTFEESTHDLNDKIKLEHLPPEIINQIFNFLSVQDVEKAGMACKQLKICRNEHYITKLIPAYIKLKICHKLAAENNVHVRDLAVLPDLDYDENYLSKACQIIPSFLSAIEKYYEIFNPEGFKNFKQKRSELATMLYSWDENCDLLEIESWTTSFKIIEFIKKIPRPLTGSWVLPIANKIDEKFNNLLQVLTYNLDNTKQKEIILSVQKLIDQVIFFWEQAPFFPKQPFKDTKYLIFNNLKQQSTIKNLD